MSLMEPSGREGREDGKEQDFRYRQNQGWLCPCQAVTLDTLLRSSSPFFHICEMGMVGMMPLSVLRIKDNV